MYIIFYDMEDMQVRERNGYSMERITLGVGEYSLMTIVRVFAAMQLITSLTFHLQSRDRVME